MKVRKRFSLLIILFGFSVLASNPFPVWGGETTGGNPWDIVLDPKPYPGVSLTGPLSIYYAIGDLCPTNPGDYSATMYYTVRLTKNDRKYYLFQGSNNVCLGDWQMQSSIIRNFIGNIVVPGIFQKFKSWKFKSIENGYYRDDDVSRAFVADIEIAVNTIKK